MPESLRIMAAGASMTSGGDPPGGYRKILQTLLAGQGVAFDFVGTKRDKPGGAAGGHEGYPGWRIAQLHQGHSDPYGTTTGLADAIRAHRPNVLLLLAGTNNLYWADPRDAAAEMQALLETVHQTDPALHTILGSILPIMPGPKPWGGEVPDSVTQRVPAYNLRLAALVAEQRQAGQRISWADHYPLVRDKDDLLADGVHANRPLFARMAWVWLCVMKAAGLF